MTTAQNDRDFIAATISASLLDDAIAWINKNLEPEDVFNKHQLEIWAEQAGYIIES